MLRISPTSLTLLLAVALIPADAQNRPQRASWLPDALEFGEGHAYMGSEVMNWEHERLVVRKRVASMKGDGSFDQSIEKLDPPPEAWKKFWTAVDSLGVWQWKPDYSSAKSSMPDGESWSLNLKYGTKQVKSKGYNAVPEKYTEFREAIRLLVEDARRPKRKSKE